MWSPPRLCPRCPALLLGAAWWLLGRAPGVGRLVSHLADRAGMTVGGGAAEPGRVDLAALAAGVAFWCCCAVILGPVRLLAGRLPRLQDAALSTEVVVLAVHDPKGVVSQEGLRQVDEVSQAAAAAEGVVEVVSLTTLDHVRVLLDQPEPPGGA